MPEGRTKEGKRLLDPTERVSEILFGLVMVLTTTCSFSVGGAGQTEVRQMLIGALGCNLAWGIIDAAMYLMACFSARGRGIMALRAVHAALDPAVAHGVIAEAMLPLLASVASPTELEGMRLRLNQLPDPGLQPRLTKDDFLGALGVFLLVVLSTLPVVLPFLFVDQPRRALRLSNAVAIVLLFLAGYVFGRHARYRPWLMGLGMVLVGGIMVAMTIALGG